MMKRKPSQSSKPVVSALLYQVKVTLVDAKPPIWRRLTVSSLTTLDRLHEVIQVAMGWEDCHLHQFEHQAVIYSSEELFEADDQIKNEAKYRLADVLKQPKDQMAYVYDFGENWQHMIVLEKIVPMPRQHPRVVVVQAEGACPLEEIGGLDGYYYWLDVLAHPDDPDYQTARHQEMRGWAAPDFDARFYDLKTVNSRLQKRF
jgi:hypothetical protein